MSQKRISRATGDKLAKYFMTEAGIKVASRAIACVAGTVTAACPALVTMGGVVTVYLASSVISYGVDKLYDFFSSGEAENYFQELGQKNYARFAQEQAEWEAYLKQHKEEQEKWQRFQDSLIELGRDEVNRQWQQTKAQWNDNLNQRAQYNLTYNAPPEVQEGLDYYEKLNKNLNFNI